MTSLYMDTNIGCIEAGEYRWTAKDEGRVSLLERIMHLFR